MTGAAPAPVPTRLDLTLSNPVVAAVIAFVEQAAIPISRARIRADFAALAGFPRLRLAEVQEVFDAWGIPSTAFRTVSSELRAIPLPAIAVLDDPGAQPTRHLVVVRAWGGEDVDLFHPLRGGVHLPWHAFLAQWTGMMFVAVAAEAAGEAHFSEIKAREQADAAAYRASIQSFEAFCPPTECAAIIAHCESGGLFARSPVEALGRPQRQGTSPMRTSSSAFLPDRADPLLARLYARVAERLAVAPGWIEDIQCVRYDPGQEFHIHIDGRGRRRTMLLYLNDHFEGGETWFPDIGLTVVPRAGTALLFRNLDEAGRAIPWSRHAGLPPRGGRKYACNIWIG